jgi:A/G-specific adenine glycosylase
MELGALVCLPRQPLCGDCPLRAVCVAYKKGLTGVLPLKNVRKAPKDRYFNYFYIECGGKSWLRKRSGRDIWHSLFEFPLIETVQETDWNELRSTEEWKALFGDATLAHSRCIKYRHKLTHQTLHATMYRVEWEGQPDLPAEFQPAALADLALFALPRLLVRFLEDLAKEMP